MEVKTYRLPDSRRTAASHPFLFRRMARDERKNRLERPYELLSNARMDIRRGI
ncbi:MAG: hypothetical protein FWG05_00430 [Kiritimatiellaeota bacterium]|nr:hypothetical protein [Kiritimatiellota bacterium]